MERALPIQRSYALKDQFFCRGYQSDVRVQSCIDNYVDANALQRKEVPCFNCQQGLEVRNEFAGQ
ncbi:MAG: hypothetical protein KC609_08955 [Myxococcales bacterium]|nr:hypothetical protein [Myxococcales bacterium]